MRKFKPVLFGSKNHPIDATHGIYKSSMFQFALFSKENYQATLFAACRAWCSDSMYYYMNGKNGLGAVNFNPKKVAPSMNTLRVGVQSTSLNENNAKCIVDFLNKIEADMGIKKPTTLYYDEKTKIYLFVADKLWQHSIIMMSFYTLLIRNIWETHKLENTWEQTLRETVANTNRRDMHSFLTKTSVNKQIESIKRIVTYGIKNVFYKRMAENYTGKLRGAMHDFGADAFFAQKADYFGNTGEQRAMFDHFFREIKTELPKAEEYVPEIKLIQNDNIKKKPKKLAAV